MLFGNLKIVQCHGTVTIVLSCKSHRCGVIISESKLEFIEKIVLIDKFQ